MRVLLVSPGFPPVRGGVEEHVGQLVDELTAAGHVVEVLTARRGVARKTREQRGAASLTIYPAWGLQSMSISPGLLWAALRVGRRAGGGERGRYDLLHVHSYHAANAVAVLNPRFAGRVVFTPHYHGGGHTPLARLLHRGYQVLGRRLFAAAAAVVCVSRAERDQLLADVPGLSPERVSVIPNGVDTAALTAAEPLAGEPPTVLSVGRLEPYKRIDRLIEAFAEIAMKDEAHSSGPAQLMIIGVGSQEAELRAQIDRLGLGDRVRLLGAVDDATLHRWLATARVLASLSGHEAFGMAPLEAAAAGCRIVLSDIAAHREIAGDYLTGVATLVDPADRAAVAAALAAQLTPAKEVAGRDAAGRADARQADARQADARQADARQGTGAPAKTRIPSWIGIAEQTAALYRSVAQAPVPRPQLPVGAIDLPWIGFWCAMAAGPLQPKPVAQVRAVLLDFMAAHPEHPLACRLDAGAGRWIPVPTADRASFVESMVVGADILDLDGLPTELVAHCPPLDSREPLRAVIGANGIVLYMSHAVGDAATFFETVLILLRADPERLAALDRRAVLGDVVGVIPRQERGVYQAWAGRALATLRTQDQPESAMPPPPPSAPPVTPRSEPAERRLPEPGIEGMALDNPQLRALTAWRNAHHPGASITAVLASRLCLGFAGAGIPMRQSGFYSLFDLRAVLAEESGRSAKAGRSERSGPGAPMFGNLGKSLYLEADLSDPSAVDRAIKDAVQSRRVAPAVVVGSLLTKLERLRRGEGFEAARTAAILPASDCGPVTMTFSSMPTMPGVNDVTWGEGRRRYMGLGYPTLADGVSVFALRFRDRLEISVSFDRSRIDPAQVREGIAAVAV